jgi:hypothetical protein
MRPIIVNIILVIVFSISCDYWYQKQIGENYFIRCIESRDRMDIGFGTSESSEGLIGNTVFEVHWNNKYILAKRHPAHLGASRKSVIEYYVVKKVKFGEAKASQNMYGPLNLEEYEKKKRELGLDEGKMESVVFEDLK